jgi:predicted membrane protein
MEGIDPWSLAAGILLLFGGVGFLIGGLIIPILMIYGIIGIIIGIFILATLKKQEEIEQIKTNRKGKGK